MDIAKQIRHITKADATASYEKLKEANCEQELKLGRVGTDALDYFFFKHRLRAKTKNHLSFMDAIRTPHLKDHLNELVLRYKKKKPSELSAADLLKNQYQVFQLYYGTINQFRPLAAKWLYCLMKPSVGILDFSAGWGGRCIAAMSLGIPYTGIDTNVHLRTGYDAMVKMYEPTARVKMIFEPSETVDFSMFKYDLVFTSPPYFKLEEYEKMPAYKDKKDFLQRFFIPVVLKAWKHLLPGGHLALNMPEEMYEAVESLLPRIQRILHLPLANRHAANASRQISIGKKLEKRTENIYVWYKRRVGKTRKHRMTRNRTLKKNSK